MSVNHTNNVGSTVAAAVSPAPKNRKWINLTPAPKKPTASTPINPRRILKTLQRATTITDKPLFKSLKLSKISQMTQTASLYKVNCRKISRREVGCLTSPPTTPMTNASSACATPSDTTTQTDKFKDFGGLIDEEESNTYNTLTSNASQTYRNLNHLNYVEDESTLNCFANGPFTTASCHIETQTELVPFADDSRDMDPLLYTHMHTQTCDDILSELGLTNIHTQTNWPVYNDLFVSTETQTCFPEISMGDCATQTQTIDMKKMLPNKMETEFSLNNQWTQTQQADYWLADGEIG